MFCETFFRTLIDN